MVHRFGRRAEAMHAHRGSTNCAYPLIHLCYACIPWQILVRLLDDVCDTGSTAAASRPFSARLDRSLSRCSRCPALSAFGLAVVGWILRLTPTLQARNDLMHLDERLLRLLPALFRIAPLTTQLVEYHFCFHHGGLTRARLDRWAGTDTTMRHDRTYVLDHCGFTQE